MRINRTANAACFVRGECRAGNVVCTAGYVDSAADRSRVGNEIGVVYVQIAAINCAAAMCSGIICKNRIT